MMKSKLMLTVMAFSILLGFTAAFAQTATTVTADQVKAALDKFTAARAEYQTLVRSGAEKTAIDAAYSKFIAAQAEYQKLNKAAGDCLTPGSGKQANQNGNGLKKRDGSCGQSGTQSGASGAGKMQGKGKGRGGR